jgi:2-dehydropantoate 2-reductase
MGTGGVGGYFGARLAQGGSDVVFIARGAHLAALREHGLIVESKLGDVSLPKVQATDDPSTLGSVDVVLIGVKLWDTEAAGRAISANVGPTTAVLSLQNGVQKDDVLRRILGSEPVLGGVCYIASTIARPGIIRHTGTLQKLVFGEYDGRRSARAQAFLEACWRGGIDAELSSDIRKAIWEKFVFLVWSLCHYHDHPFTYRPHSYKSSDAQVPVGYHAGSRCCWPGTRSAAQCRICRGSTRLLRRTPSGDGFLDVP